MAIFGGSSTSSQPLSSPQQTSTSRLSSFGRSSSHTPRHSGGIDPFDSGGTSSSSWSRYGRWCPSSVDPTRILWMMDRCIRSWAWRMFMVFFSVFLLFGAQIQHLWTAPAGDIVFDILAMFTFAFFLVDMTIRIFVEPNYCNISFSCCRGGYESRACSLGSFMFWCDLASTGVILYEVSFINKPHYEVISVDIDLDESGLPVSMDIFPHITA